MKLGAPVFGVHTLKDVILMDCSLSRKQAGIALLMSGIMDFNQKLVKREKEGGGGLPKVIQM